MTMNKWRHALTCCLVVLVAACSGSDDAPVPEDRKMPTASVRATAQSVSSGSTASLQTSLGATVALDATGSTPGSGAIASTNWIVSARPTGSTAAIADPTALQARFKPDATGAYTLELRVVDSAGGSATATLALNVGPAAATPSLVTAVSFEGTSTQAPLQSVAIGTPVTLDASSSSDPAGGSLTLEFSIVTKPGASTAALATTGSRTVFTPDVVGDYLVRVRATTSAGTVADSLHPYTVNDGAPRVLVSGNVSAPVAQGARLRAAVGNVVTLQGFSAIGFGLTDASWAITRKPVFSQVDTLTPNGSNGVRFVPDTSGSFVVQLTARPSAGSALETFAVTVEVDPGPQIVVSALASPVAAATGPSFLAAPGRSVTLRGTGSNDPAGGSLTYSWALRTVPSGNTGTLATPSEETTTFTPTIVGRYEVELTVRTETGLTATQSVTLLVGTSMPTAAVERQSVLALVGQPARVSAAPSSSPSGNALTYSWAIDASPTGSSATIANPGAITLDFTPDVAGTYTASVTVSDGPLSAVVPVTITALSPSAGVMPLTYTPGVSRYNRATGRLVVASAAPDALHLIDPVAQSDVAIPLPASARALSVSPSGRWAAVLHDNTATLVDLSSQAVVRSFFTLGGKNDLAVLNNGVVVLGGLVSSSFGGTQQGYLVIDGVSGNTLQTLPMTSFFSGSFRMQFADLSNRLVAVTDCCGSPQVTAVDPTTSLLTHQTSPSISVNSPGGAFWLTGDQAYVVTAASALHRTSDFILLGNLLPPLTGGFFSSSLRLLSFSQSTGTGESVGLESLINTTCCDSSPRLPASFKRWTGGLFFAATDVALPSIGNDQSYGLAIFHAADDRRLVLVQTGGDRTAALGLRYYLILR